MRYFFRFTLFTIFIVISTSAFSQTTQLNVTTETQPREGRPIILNVAPNLPNATFSRVILRYRQPNDEWQEAEMRFAQGKYTYTISDLYSLPPSLDYYILAYTSTNDVVSFPTNNPESVPAALTILPRGLEDNINVLLGAEDAKNPPEDFMVMLSYYRLSEVIDITSIKFLVNGEDKTSEASISSDILSWLPMDEPPLGSVSLSFSAKLKDGSVVGPLTWSTAVVSKEEAIALEEAKKNWNFGGNFWDEVKYESISGKSNSYHRANLSFSGNFHWLTYSANVYKTSEEKNSQQASDRYTFKMGLGEYWDFTFGDAYPSFSRVMMNGSRVRGFETNLKLRWINVDFTYGKLARAIDSDFYLNADTTVLDTDPNRDDIVSEKVTQGYVVTDKTGGKTTLKLQRTYGTYDRNLMAAKLSFGPKDGGFNFGIGVLRAIDDTTSIKFGDRASANVVVSTDATLKLDNNRFELYGDFAFSLNNSDITQRNRIIDSTARATLGSNFDLVNNIIPITAGIGVPGSADGLYDYATIQAGLKLNYFNNFLKVEYLRNGQSYRSDGLPFFQNDIKGFKINDRLRLFSNKLFLTFALDNLQDNTNGAKDLKLVTALGEKVIDGTTTRKIIRGGFSVFPGANYPSFSFDMVKGENVNALPDTVSASSNNATTTFQVSSNYGFVIGESYHTVNVSLAISKKEDARNEANYLNRFGLSPTDQSSRAIALSYGTTLKNDLSVNFSYTNSLSQYAIAEIVGSTPGAVGYAKKTENETSFNILEGGVGKSFLNNRLKIGGRANLTLADNNQYLFGGNAQYNFTQNFFATYDINYLMNAGATNDFLTGLRLQYIF